MSDTAETVQNAEEQAEYKSILRRRAAAITSVRNDVFGAKLWQNILSFAIAVIAVAGLIVSMVTNGVVRTVFTVIGVVFVLIFLVIYFTMRTLSPASFQQFTCIDRGKTYRYQVFSPKRSAFSDGVNNIEVERGEGSRLRELTGGIFRYDYFVDMQDITRSETNDGKEVFSGVIVHDGKTYKCKIAFDGETPIVGEIGGSRIKYFDINNTKQKFIVPTELRNVIKSMGIPFPKLVGLHVRDDKTNRGGGQ